MPAELEAHRGQQLVGELRLAARTESRVERGAENGHRHGLVDGRLDRPPSLAGIRHPAVELRERRILEQGGRCQIQQPRRDHAAAPPDLRDIAQIEVELELFGVAQRGRLGIGSLFTLTHIGVREDIHSLGIGRHEAVLDAVMHHLDEVAGAARPAVQIALIGGASDLLAPRSGRDVAHAGCQRPEHRLQVPHRLVRSPDHQAVASLQAHHPAARPAIDVLDLLGCEIPRPSDVVHIVGVAAVDEDVAGLEMREDVGDESFHERPRNHHPDRARLLHLLHEIRKRGCPDGPFLDHLLDRLGRPIVDHTLMVSLEQAPHHVRAHPAKTDHSDLHHRLHFKTVCFVGFRSRSD